MKNFCLAVNTVSTSRDLWKMFFGQLEKHYPGNKVYVFTDEADGMPAGCEVVRYDPRDNFRTQYLKCLKSVKEDFIMNFNEDYILYGDVDRDAVGEYVSLLSKDDSISFIRFTRGSNFTPSRYGNREDLFYLDNRAEYFYSQTVAIWKKPVLEKIHEIGPDLHIAGKRTKLQFEVEANKVCARIDIKGLVSYRKEPKRGLVHYDSSVVPYIASALVKGKWNLGEYEKELGPILAEYGIDYGARGRV
ncbi:MAG: hypothetical protein HY896_03455 [Deltaproteobacteria bacterium]|nr:hypothetical protein [Deltaproteobacteria bacterium]